MSFGGGSSSQGSPIVVAIDGPSGSGKSSVARQVAAALGLAYLDTGAQYRAVAVAALRSATDVQDAAAVAALVSTCEFSQHLDPRTPDIALGGHDITAQIRTPAVTAVVSAIAANPAVRASLIARQRGIIAAECSAGGFSHGRGIVVEGRDITTVVAPAASVRILLTAQESVRLERRARELHGSAEPEARVATAAQIGDRDAADSQVTSFMVAAPGVATIDSSALSFDETVAAVLAEVRRQVDERTPGGGEPA